MNRLTEWRNGHGAVVDRYENYIDRLAEYEDTGFTPGTLKEILDGVQDWYDANKEGRLIVLPCKPGDMVWVISAFFNRIDPPAQATVKRIEFNGEKSLVPVQVFLWMDIGDGNKEYGYSLDSIGKAIFLTREDAEDALRRSNG